MGSIIIYFLYYFLSFNSWNESALIFPTGDNSFYARLSNYMVDFGIENTRLSYIEINTTPEPYHYWDIWLIGIAKSISGLNSSYSLMLIVYPFLCSLFALGAFTYFSTIFNKNRFILCLVSIFLCLFAGFRFIEILPYFRDGYILSPSVSTKALFIGCLLVLSLTLIGQKRWNALIIYSALSGVGFVNLLPAFSIALFVFLSYLILFRKNVFLKDILIGLIVSAALFIYFYYFYKGSKTFSISPQINLFYIRKIVSSLVGSALQFFVLLPFFLLFIFLIFKKKRGKYFALEKSSLFFIFGIAISGFLASSFLWQFSAESVQFFYNVFIPVSAIFIGYVILKSLELKNPFVNFFCFLLVGIMLFLNNRYQFMLDKVNKRDFDITKSFVEKNGEGFFVNERTESEFVDIYEKNTPFKAPLLWISFFDEKYQSYSLDIPIIKADSASVFSKIEDLYIRNAPFSLYLTKNKMGVTDMFEESKKNFITEVKAKYMQLSPKEGFPEYIRGAIFDSVVLSNKWKIYALQMKNMQ